MTIKTRERKAKRQAKGLRPRDGVVPYPFGERSDIEDIEAGEQREEVPGGLRKEQAVALGRKLRDRMDGHGWRLHVWQNLGWRYTVHRGPLSVYPVYGCRGGVTYLCRLAAAPEDTSGSGAIFWPDQSRRRNPNAAVASQLVVARAFVERCVLAIEAASSQL